MKKGRLILFFTALLIVLSVVSAAAEHCSCCSPIVPRQTVANSADVAKASACMSIRSMRGNSESFKNDMKPTSYN